jgi:membrane protease YdiL (CAAX protease family)
MNETILSSPSCIEGKMQTRKWLYIVSVAVLITAVTVAIHHLLEWKGSSFQGWLLAIGIHVAVVYTMTWLWTRVSLLFVSFPDNE